MSHRTSHYHFRFLDTHFKIIYYFESAAHCFYGKGAFKQGHDTTNSYVVAGKHDLRYFEASAQKRNLLTIVIHPDWRPDATNFDADISLATTEYPFYFTSSVQPICLPNFNAVLIHPLGKVVVSDEDQSCHRNC